MSASKYHDNGNQVIGYRQKSLLSIGFALAAPRDQLVTTRLMKAESRGQKAESGKRIASQAGIIKPHQKPHRRRLLNVRVSAEEHRRHCPSSVHGKANQCQARRTDTDILSPEHKWLNAEEIMSVSPTAQHERDPLIRSCFFSFVLFFLLLMRVGGGARRSMSPTGCGHFPSPTIRPRFHREDPPPDSPASFAFHIFIVYVSA